MAFNEEYINIDNINTQNFFYVLEHLGRYRFAMNFIKKRNFESVLDIASADGYGTALLASVVKNITGADINHELLKKAKDRKIKNAKFFQLDFDKDDFSPFTQIYDCIVCFETLEHLSNPQKFMDNLVSMIRGNSRILLSVPNSEYEQLDANNKLVNQYHKNCFTENDINDILKKAGLEIEKQLGQGLLNTISRNHNSYLSRNKDFYKKKIYNTAELDYFIKMFAYPTANDCENSYSKIFILRRKKS